MLHLRRPLYLLEVSAALPTIYIRTYRILLPGRMYSSERRWIAVSKPTCQLVQSGESYVGKQAFTYFAGISAENTGAQAICMHLLHVPPGGRAKAHFHESHETTLYVLAGRAGMWWGEELEEHMVCEPGDFIYIPAGVPHLPYNLSETEPCSAVVARTDPKEQESVVLRPDLDEIHGP